MTIERDPGLLDPDGPDLSPTVRAWLEDCACAGCGKPGNLHTLSFSIIARTPDDWRPMVVAAHCEDCGDLVGGAWY